MFFKKISIILCGPLEEDNYRSSYYAIIVLCIRTMLTMSKLIGFIANLASLPYLENDRLGAVEKAFINTSFSASAQAHSAIGLD